MQPGWGVVPLEAQRRRLPAARGLPPEQQQRFPPVEVRLGRRFDQPRVGSVKPRGLHYDFVAEVDHSHAHVLMLTELKTIEKR